MPVNWEVINRSLHRGPCRVAVFDFDGTVSLIREGWSRVMAELGRDHLHDQALLREPVTNELSYLEREMLLLSGKPSLFQMQRLADEIAARGGRAPDTHDLLRQFLTRLFTMIESRVQNLESGRDQPHQWVLPGTHELLSEFHARGIVLVLASGTDAKFVRKEAALLDLARFFGERIYAPADNTPHFSKADVFRKYSQPGEVIVSFGDGYSETVEAKRVGGIAVGVASNEAHLGGVNMMKRELLIELGADVIVADYREGRSLVSWLIAR
jgi:phosphoglycolate phosphatase